MARADQLRSAIQPSAISSLAISPDATGSRPRDTRRSSPPGRPPRRPPRPGDEGITCPDRGHVEHPDSVHPMPAHEQRRPRRAEPGRRAVPSPPTFPTFAARGSRDRSPARCSEWDRANRQTTRSGCHRDGERRTAFPDRGREAATRPARPGHRARARRTSHSYMRCGMRGDGTIASGGPTSRRPGEVVVEEGAPFLHHEPAASRRDPARWRPALGIPIDHDEPPPAGLAPLPGSDQLAGVKRAVASAAHDDGVAELDAIGCVVRHRPREPPR